MQAALGRIGKNTTVRQNGRQEINVLGVIFPQIYFIRKISKYRKKASNIIISTYKDAGGILQM